MVSSRGRVALRWLRGARRRRVAISVRLARRRRRLSPWSPTSTPATPRGGAFATAAWRTAWPRVRLSVHGRVSQQSVCALACRRPAGATRSLRAGPWRPARRQSEELQARPPVLAVYGRRARLFCILRQEHLQLSTRHSLSIPDTAKDLCTLSPCARAPLGPPARVAERRARSGRRQPASAEQPPTRAGPDGPAPGRQSAHAPDCSPTQGRRALSHGGARFGRGDATVNAADSAGDADE